MKKWPRTAIERAARAAAKVPKLTLQVAFDALMRFTSRDFARKPGLVK